jgi:hypothetical protein
MKKIFTSLCLVAGGLLIGSQASAQGFAWSYSPSEATPVVIDENFQDWTTNHSIPGAAATGRSVPYVDWQQEVTYKAGANAGQKLAITLFQCAVNATGLSQNQVENNEQAKTNVVNPAIAAPGFLEVSRFGNNSTKDLPEKIHGSVTVAPVPGAIVVQYSYSSVGGTKRGVKLEQSLDGGTTWEVVRNPTKLEVEAGSADGSTVDGADYWFSGAGKQLEDYIGTGADGESVALRFSINDGTDVTAWQDYRIHDLKIIALADAIGGTGINVPEADAFQVIPLSEYIATSRPATIQIYNLNGQLVKQATAATRLNTVDLAKGVYIVKATGEAGSVTKKYVH